MPGNQTARRLALAALAVLTLGRLPAANAYDRADYREGNIIHAWPKHGVWQLELVSGGQSSGDRCVIGASTGVYEPTLILNFIFDAGDFSTDSTLNFTDGGSMQIFFLDKNFMALNEDNFLSSHDWLAESSVAMSVDDWQIFHYYLTRKIVTIDGVKWAASPPSVVVAWDMKNPGDKYNKTLEVLNRMRAGKELVMNSYMLTHHITLAGFQDVLNELTKCIAMKKDGK